MAILIDGHIHIHPAFDLESVLDEAWNNFLQTAKRFFSDVLDCSFVLLLAEGKQNDVFSALVKRAGKEKSQEKSSWFFTPTAETNSVLAISGEKKIFLIAGRQLITSEKLELLSLFCPHVFADNLYSLQELAERVTREGGLPLLTWGVGKWFGRRGQVVQEFLTHPSVSVFLVGDNGNRPDIWPYPSLLSQAEKQGLPSLPGSDPLSLACHEGRAGSYGGIIKDAVLKEENPADGLKKLFCSGIEILPFGKGLGLLQFVRDQLQVNVQKRLGRSGH